MPEQAPVAAKRPVAHELYLCAKRLTWCRPISTCPTPQVNYREGISRTAEVRYVHKKQSGGSGQFADVAIRFEPGEVRGRAGG